MLTNIGFTGLCIHDKLCRQNTYYTDEPPFAIIHFLLHTLSVIVRSNH